MYVSNKKLKKAVSKAVNEKKRKIKNKKKKKSPEAKYLGPVLSALGQGLGSVASDVIGIPGLSVLGNKLGGRAANWIKKVTGFGDYKVSGNSLLSQSKLPGPYFKGTASTNVSFHIPVKQIYADGTANFQYEKFALTPSNPLLSARLCKIAKLYEQWKPLGILVGFSSTSGNVASSQYMGDVHLAHRVDKSFGPFLSAKEMMVSRYNVHGRTDEDLILPIECDLKDLQVDVFSTRPPGSTTSLAEERMESYGDIQIAYYGQPSAGVIGWLELIIHVKFLCPELPITGNDLQFHADTAPATADFGKDAIVHSGSSPLISLESTPAYPFDCLVFRSSGRYLINWIGKEDGGAITPPWVDPGYGTGATLVSWYRNHSRNHQDAISSTSAFYLVVVDIDVGSEPYVYIQNPTFVCTGSIIGDVTVVEIGTGLENQSVSSSEKEKRHILSCLNPRRPCYATNKLPSTMGWTRLQRIEKLKQAIDQKESKSKDVLTF